VVQGRIEISQNYPAFCEFTVQTLNYQDHNERSEFILSPPTLPDLPAVLVIYSRPTKPATDFLRKKCAPANLPCFFRDLLRPLLPLWISLAQNTESPKENPMFCYKIFYPQVISSTRHTTTNVVTGAAFFRTLRKKVTL